MKQLFTCLILSILITPAFAQAPDGGGEFVGIPHDDITPQQRAQIFEQIATNEVQLKAEGKMPLSYNKTAATAFEFPMAFNDGFTGYNFYAISNYVDHNASYPNVLQDWNCGTRTYDTDAGYNHQGIDYFLWPFDWNLMEAGAVKIVAAAPGMIVGKYDGNFDKNCAFNPGSWNAIYLRHDDGSLTWYGHMKNGSLTDKGLGDMVETGEYLGTVGSSGNSTGPHLHFEVYDADDNLIDPYIGTCNDWNLETWWADQPEYIAPEINRMQTHTAPPEFTTCPNPVITNEQNNFMPGDPCYFALYAKDLSASDLCHLRITKADGSIWYDWNFNQPADYYVASFWYWFYNIPADAPEGVWTWSCELDGVYYEHEFIVGELPISVENVNPLQHATANYANGNIQIHLNNTEALAAEISVVNMLGQNITSANSIMANVSAVTNIAVDNVEAGCYFVVINCNNQLTSIPVMLHE